MNFKLTVARKIGLGFGFLILLIIVVFGATFFAVTNGIETYKESDKTSNILIESITPSKEKIAELISTTTESKQLIIQWVNQVSRSDVPYKLQLKSFMNKTIPVLVKEIELLAVDWPQEDRAALKEIKAIINSVFERYLDVMSYLPDIESYNDAGNRFLARTLVDQNGDIRSETDQLNYQIDLLYDNFEEREEDLLKKAKAASEISKENFQALNFYWILGALLIVLAIGIAFFTTRSIVKPVRYLRKVLLALGKGIIPKKSARVSNDEIGDMSQALNHLVIGLKKTTTFARDVGQSKFDSPYKPLSQDDELGHALLVMRDDLKETERNLEQKVEERTQEIVKQKDEIDSQRLKLEDLYKDVTDSIVYAKRLQNTILPPEDKMQRICPNSFVLYKPKDIVSGDFYWFEERKGKSLFAVVDCTGHGVPGAFMSLLGSTGLNSALAEESVERPSEILDFLNKSIYESLNKGTISNEVRDGMDVAICSLDYSNLTLDYSGANNALYIIRNDAFLITKPNKMSIGSFAPGQANFENHTIQLEKGDTVYIFSDGYPDQFGGPKGRKLMYSNFRDYLLTAKDLPIDEQSEFLDKKLLEWQGKMDQIDDILLIGLKV